MASRGCYAGPPPLIALRQTLHRGPSCPGGCARIPGGLLQGRVPIPLPPLLGGDITTAAANAARSGVGLGAACADVVESLNAILKRAYNNHTARVGGMLVASAWQREAEVIFQAWERWFLKFHVPLRTHGASGGVPCTMAKLLATQSPPNCTLLLAPPRGCCWNCYRWNYCSCY